MTTPQDIDAVLDDTTWDTWHGHSTDAARWVPDGADRLLSPVDSYYDQGWTDIGFTSPTYELRIDPEMWQQAWAQVQQSINVMAEHISAASFHWGPLIETWAKLLPEPSPAEPRARALALRRSRNHGPDNRPSLDGRRRAKR